MFNKVHLTRGKTMKTVVELFLAWCAGHPALLLAALAGMVGTFSWFFFRSLYKDVFGLTVGSDISDFWWVDLRVTWIAPILFGAGVATIAAVIEATIGLHGLWSRLAEGLLFSAVFLPSAAWWAIRNLIPRKDKDENRFRMWKISLWLSAISLLPTVAGISLLVLKLFI